VQTTTRFSVTALALGLTLPSLALAQAFHYLPAPHVAVARAAGPSYVARVIDARPQRASLGLVMNGSTPLAATFREGIASTLNAFFGKYAPGQPGAVPLVLRVSGLEIAELPGSLVEGRLGQMATAGLVADFYAPQPDSSYRLVAHFAQLREQKAIDVTDSHAANLGSLLLAVAEAGAQPAQWLPNGPRYPKASVLSPEALPSETLPVLEPTVRPQPGFYHSLADFWYNKPSEPGQPLVERRAYAAREWAGDQEVKAYRFAGGRNVLATDVWGFSDGQDFYLRRGYNFYKLARRGTDFLFFGPADEDVEFRKASSARAANAGLMAGGMLGGALAGIADASLSDGPRAQLKLSTLTGEVRLAQSHASAATAVANRPTNLFIYRLRDAKGPAVRIRLADDLPAQDLVAGDFLSFEPASDQPLRVCLLPATGPPVYLAVIPTSEAPTYIECRPTAGLPLRRTDDKTGAAALTKLSK
jgi:hypothetical protein